ncbi:MAG: gluconate transporter [Saprospiraceae bacterium]|nr:gluconate transporter [Saprospiraceae bacterium]
MTLLIILFAILFQVFLTAKKVSPFLSLLLVAILTGLMLGMAPSAILVSLEKGVGSTLGSLALIICLGAILGKILEESGAAERITTTLISKFGEKNIQWAIMLTGFLIGIPLYYNAGFVILVPLVFSLARKTQVSLLFVAIPMAAALSTTHCFLPPHPGPVFLVNAFKADLGKTLVYGLIISVPVVVLAGPVLGRFLKSVQTETSLQVLQSQSRQKEELPGAWLSFLIALLPVLLIAASVITNNILPDGWLKKSFSFLGDANIALLISVLLAIYFFGLKKGETMETTMTWLNGAISGISVILLIITAGGVFKQILTDSGTAAYISSFSSQWQMPPLLFGWIITALLRVTIGSATVAGITAAGVVTPIVLAGQVSPELMVLAVGTGSVFGSHINDTGFWMFKEFFNLTLKQTFQSWTLMETLISILGLIGVLILDLFV